MGMISVNVVPDTEKGVWSVKNSRAKEASVRLETKEAAIKFARVLCVRNAGKMVVFDAEGNIEREDEKSGTNVMCASGVTK